ncbi:MAG: hypothetical protein BWY63_02810 [Chloroflexi bacterium ADurb.Bin360]|nr:MAG: hypothetical protein BWY63_02810 [Chloroflexi bacterium ADurb.Bin360]
MCDELLRAHNHAAERIAVPTEELGRGVNDYIHAQFQRTLIIGCGEGVIYEGQDTPAARQCCDGSNIVEGECGIAG